MIHSLSGGVLKENTPIDFAKVKIINNNKIAWYICSHLPDLKENDKVLVPVGIDNFLEEAVVLRIDKQISPQVTPTPIKRTKKIYSIIN